MSNLTDLDVLAGAELFVLVGQVWSRARVLEFSGGCVKLRVTNEQLGIVYEDWVDVADVHLSIPQDRS